MTVARGRGCGRDVRACYRRSGGRRDELKVCLMGNRGGLSAAGSADRTPSANDIDASGQISEERYINISVHHDGGRRTERRTGACGLEAYMPSCWQRA